MSEVDSSATSDATDESGGQSQEEALLGTVVAERYRVEEKLGEGGMGAVYRAEHVLMKKPVALKVLHREMTVMEEVVKRFEREAIAAGRIEHPNVTVATDFGKLEGGAFYLVLEYLPGKSLTEVLKQEGSLAPERAVFIARQVASALAAAHGAQIVHRDLKPDNIMLLDRGGISDFVKVLDFGIAKLAPDATGGQQLTRLGTVFGTPQYMAPEQAAGKPVDHRADLYALGIILHEMLAGSPPFAAEEIVVLLTKQLTEPPPPLDEGIDPALRRLVWKLLKKEPDERVQTADELVSELDGLLGANVPMPDSGLVGASSARASMKGRPESLEADAAAATPMEATRLDALPSSRGDARLAEAATQLHSSSSAPSPIRATLDRLKHAAGPLWSRMQEVLERPVPIAGRRLPLWMPAAAAGALLVVIGVVLGAAGDEEQVVAQGSGETASEEPTDSEQSRLLALARAGNRDALAELESIDEDERSAEHWVALAEGNRKIGDALAALDAYHRALERDPELSSDRGLRAFVRRAVETDKTRDKALEIAAEAMGAHGADLLFDVWASTSRVTETTTAAKEWLDKDSVREAASPALSIALDLREAENCSEFEKLLSRAVQHADRRSLRPLKKLTRRRGCGFLQLNDCYSCLRGDDQLKEAVTVAQRTSAPRF